MAESGAENPRQKALRNMKRIVAVVEKNHDNERGHRMADDVLCQLLLDLGEAELVTVYDSFSKWYA